MRSIILLCKYALLALLLSGCSAPPTYADTRATAAVTGCWPDRGGYPTPRAITVTPFGEPTATLVYGPMPDPLMPTLTALPSTTPLPRCPPGADATLVPWPTPIPNPPPWPTREPKLISDGGAQQTTLELPVNVLTIDLAAHPTENWPAVAGVVWSGNQDPDRVMVSVLNPETRAWSFARQVDLGESRIGRYSRSVAVTVTLDRTIVVVWAMSDPDFANDTYPSRAWSASSSDYGQTWSAPVQVASGCPRVNGLTTADDGTVVAMLICEPAPRTGQAALVVRSPDGHWSAPERVNAPAWLYSEGALVVTGRGVNTRVVGLVLGGRNGMPTASLISGPAHGGAWQVNQLPISSPAGETGERLGHVRGLAYTRPSGETAVSFVFAGIDAPSGVYALTSLDGGATWTPPETILFFGTGGVQARYASPFYDPAADRLLIIAQFGAEAAWDLAPSNHLARWSIPGSGHWHTPGGEDAGTLIPLANGSRAAWDTATAQAQGVRVGWLAWKESLRRIEVRSIDFNQIVPIDQYPPPTVTPTATG